MIGKIKIKLKELVGKEIRTEYDQVCKTLLQAGIEADKLNYVLAKWGIEERLEIKITLDVPRKVDEPDLSVKAPPNRIEIRGYSYWEAIKECFKKNRAVE